MLDINEIQKISMDCSMTEFVGTTVLVNCIVDI